MKKIIFLFFWLIGKPNFAQNQMQGMNMTDDTVKTNKDTIPRTPMSHAFSLNLPMNRNGSGTGWSPDSTPMFGYMIHAKKWTYMVHGNIFLRYNNQDIYQKGKRGGEKFDAINWLMFMGQRRMGKRGLFRFNTMFSLDDLFGGNGYPLLFQTGESWQNKPLVDRQHPHDLFSELSISYAYAVNKNTDVFIYGGYPGEPALGSVAFMHRVSATYDPDAPLSHHWNDGTHITFGVISAGIRFGKCKLDASSFTGREPDENRYNLDVPRFDSYSARVSFNPCVYWAIQLSEGFIKSPEALHPSDNVYRTTASVVYCRPFKANNFFTMTILSGTNNGKANENALLTEASLVLNRLAIYGRYECVQKSNTELNLGTNEYQETTVFTINALTLGISYNAIQSKFLNMAVGTQATYFSADNRLDNLYGKNPVSGEVYIRIYPPRMKMDKM